MFKRSCVSCKFYNFKTAECKKFASGDIITGVITYFPASEIREKKCGIDNPIQYKPIKYDLERKANLIYQMQKNDKMLMLSGLLLSSSAICYDNLSYSSSFSSLLFFAASGTSGFVILTGIAMASCDRIKYLNERIKLINEFNKTVNNSDENDDEHMNQFKKKKSNCSNCSNCSNSNSNSKNQSDEYDEYSYYSNYNEKKNVL